MLNNNHNPSGWSDTDGPSPCDLDCMPTSFPGEPDHMVLAMSYVKRQKWGNVLDGDTGLCKGTIFPELVKPFRGQGGKLR